MATPDLVALDMADDPEEVKKALGVVVRAILDSKTMVYKYVVFCSKTRFFDDFDSAKAYLGGSEMGFIIYAPVYRAGM